MMNISVIQAIEIMASDVLSFAHEIVTGEEGIGDKGNMHDSVSRVKIGIEMSSRSNNVVIAALFHNYVDYIEQGRRPRQGKRPPIDALRDWAMRKGIATDNDTLWAISTAIWRDGIAPRPVFSVLGERIDEQWDRSWAVMLFETVTETLTQYFNE